MFLKYYSKLVMMFFALILCGTEVSAQGFKVLSRAEQPVLKALDQNADGILSTDEIQSSPESLKAVDKNGDGILSSAETRLKFPAGINLPQGFVGKMMRNPRVQPLMNLIDRDGDGTIDTDEIKDSSEAIRQLDADNDWRLSRSGMQYALRMLALAVLISQLKREKQAPLI